MQCSEPWTDAVDVIEGEIIDYRGEMHVHLLQLNCKQRDECQSLM
jgi:hypothetical protein